MRFFLRYVLIYAVVAALLLGSVGYLGYDAGLGAPTWLASALLAVWLFGYHGTVLWFDYRRLAKLIEDIRVGKFAEHLPPERIREAIADLAVRYGGLPSFAAGFLVRRLVTDELARELAARASAMSQRAAAAGGA